MCQIDTHSQLRSIDFAVWNDKVAPDIIDGSESQQRQGAAARRTEKSPNCKRLSHSATATLCGVARHHRRSTTSHDQHHQATRVGRVDGNTLQNLIKEILFYFSRMSTTKMMMMGERARIAKKKFLKNSRSRISLESNDFL